MNAVDVLGPGGLVQRELPGYEHRPQQLEMAELVGRALADKEHLIVEAGTGVGKSFAYLAPAIGLATGESDKRVVISTHTIALQEQLIEKDIPFLKKILPVEFKAVLVKGRSNYLCLRRLESASRRQDRLFGTERELKNLWRLEGWASETRDGSKRSLPFSVVPAVWQKICADRHSCQGRSCEQYGKCFYQGSRRKMMGAQILVVNHALFFSDLVLRAGRLLPARHRHRTQSGWKLDSERPQRQRHGSDAKQRLLLRFHPAHHGWHADRPRRVSPRRYGRR